MTDTPLQGFLLRTPISQCGSREFDSSKSQNLYSDFRSGKRENVSK